MDDNVRLLILAVIVIGGTGIIGLVLLVHVFAIRQSLVHRRELDTRADLHERDRGTLMAERDGWRNVSFDMKAKLERSYAVNAEAVMALKSAAEINAEAVRALVRVQELHGSGAAPRTPQHSGGTNGE